MSITIRISKNYAVSQGLPTVVQARAANQSNGRDIAMAAGTSGTLSTRTNDTDGTVTATGSGIATADTIAIFWPGGARYNVTVGTVSGTSIPVSGGSGDNLPIATTVVIVSKATDVTSLVFTGSAMAAFYASCNQRGIAQLFDSDPASLFVVKVPAVGEGYVWEDAGAQGVAASEAAPFSGTIADIKCYNGSTSPAVFKIYAGLYQAVGPSEGRSVAGKTASPAPAAF